MRLKTVFLCTTVLLFSKVFAQTPDELASQEAERIKTGIFRSADNYYFTEIDKQDGVDRKNPKLKYFTREVYQYLGLKFMLIKDSISIIDSLNSITWKDQR